MWKTAAPTVIYARTSGEEHEVSDEGTLADDELPLSCEELAIDDPLNEKARGRKAHLARWSGSLRRWWTRHKIARLETDAQMSLDETAPRRRPLFISLLLFLLPSWSHRFFGYPWPKEPRRATDYLDGLRGVASLCVFFDHYLMGGMEDILEFNFNEAGHVDFLQLPFLRTLFSGAAMVAIFFAISGYVLSARCITAIRSGRQSSVSKILTSMTFRRAIRLFLPSVIATVVLALLPVLFGLYPSNWPHHWSVWHELSHYEMYLKDYLFRLWSWDDPLRVFRTPDWHGWYGGQLWTIPIEFDCSMILFVLLLGVTRCKQHVRWAVEAMVFVYLMYVLRWEVALFVAGMIIVEINQLVGDARKPLAVKIVLWATLFLGWYTSGFTHAEVKHTPYHFYDRTWTHDLLTNYRMWLAVAAMEIVGSISMLPIAQRPFTTSVARYLGRISYALYLVHSQLNASVRPRIWAFFGVLEHPGHGDNPLTWSWFFVTIFYFNWVIWFADVFWRLVDIPSVQFARWIEQRCFVTVEEK